MLQHVATDPKNPNWIANPLKSGVYCFASPKVATTLINKVTASMKILVGVTKG